MAQDVVFGGVEYKLDTAAIATYMHSPDGPVGRHMIRVAENVKQLTLAGMHSKFPREFFQGRVVKRVRMGTDGLHVLVGSDRTRTEPHDIYGNPLLVFYWPKAGKTMFLRHVNHPGSDFTKYLREHLLAALTAAKYA